MKTVIRNICTILAIVLLLSMGSAVCFAADETPVDLMINGGFEEVAEDGSPVEWMAMDGWGTYASLSDEAAHSGKYSLKIADNAGKFAHASVFIDGLVPFANYEVTAYVSTQSLSATPTNGVGFKAEFYDPTKLSQGAGVASVGGDKQFMAAITQNTNGLWQKVTFNFQNSSSTAVRLYARLYCMGVAFFDDLELRFSEGPEPFSFHTSDKFHYPEDTEGSAYVELNSFYTNDAIAEETTVDFEFIGIDGEVLHTSKDVKFSDMRAMYTYDAGLITEQKQKYGVRAYVKNKEGEVIRQYTNNLYKYPRPTIINENGDYIIDGEIFFPVIAYHVEKQHYSRLKEIGVNVVQTDPLMPANAIAYLDNLYAHGLRALIALYPNMVSAGNPENVELTKAVVEVVKDHPAVFAYAPLDEPFGGVVTEEKIADAENAYKVIHDIDPVHPVYYVDAKPQSYPEDIKHSDVFCTDLYAQGDTRSVTRGFRQAVAFSGKRNKPVYELGMTFQLAQSTLPTSEDVRSWSYRILEEGGRGSGYYTISDAIGQYPGQIGTPLFETPTWEGMVAYTNNEMPHLVDYFVRKKYPTFGKFADNKDDGGGLYTASWVEGNELILIAQNRDDEDQTFEIPLISVNGRVKIGAYKAEPIGGATETIEGTGSIVLHIPKQTPVMYKITPEIIPDYSKVSEINPDGKNHSTPKGYELLEADDDAVKTVFSDLSGYDWAKDAILELYKNGVVNDKNIYQYLPGEHITRADFAMFLIKSLALTAENDVLFADVSPDAYYAAEIAVGKALGILQGDSNGCFRPDQTITRQDIMTMCIRALTLVNKIKESQNTEIISRFTDAAQIAAYARDAVSAMVEAGVVQGYEDGSFRPYDNTTRAEAAVILQRAIALEEIKEEVSEPIEEKTEQYTFADSASEEDILCWNEVKVFLEKLGILHDAFDIEASVTRQQAVKLIMYCVGGAGMPSMTDTLFADVKADNPESGYIAAAHKLGIVTGKEGAKFRPGAPVTYNEMVKMLVSALGYTVKAESMGGYPGGYITMASQMDLLRGITKSDEAVLRGGQVLQFIANALEINLFEKLGYGDNSGQYVESEQKTLLNTYLGIEKVEGQITADSHISVTDGVRAGEGRIILDGVQYPVGDSGADAFLGQNVTMYTKKNDSDEVNILFVAPKKSVYTVRIDKADVLPKSTAANIWVSDGSEEYSYDIASAPKVVINGVLQSGITADVLSAGVGSITLICNNGASADVVLVEKYKTHIVDSVRITENKILYKDGSNLILDPQKSSVDWVLLTADGKERKLTECQEWNVLSVAESADGRYIKAVCSSAKVSGEITEVTDSDVQIGNKVYKISGDFTGDRTLLRAGGHITALLDFNGNVAAVNGTGAKRNYGYLTAADVTEGISPVLMLKIFTAEGEMKTLPVAKRVVFNDSTKDGATLLSEWELKDEADPKRLREQLVNFKTNEAGEITELETAFDARKMSLLEHSQLTDFSLVCAAEDFVGIPMRTLFGNLLGSKYRIATNAVIFRVPPRYSENVQDYQIVPVSDIKHYHIFETDTRYYDCDSDFNVAAIVEKGVAMKKVDYGTTSAVITQKVQGLDPDGFPTTNLQIITSKNAQRTVSFSSDDFNIEFGSTVLTDAKLDPVAYDDETLPVTITPDKLCEGDVIQLDWNEKNVVIGMRVLFRAKTPPAIGSYYSTEGQGDTYHYADATRVYTTVTKTTSNGLLVSKPWEWLFPYSYSTNPAVVLYNSQRDSFALEDTSVIEANDKVVLVTNRMHLPLIVIYR